MIIPEEDEITKIETNIDVGFKGQISALSEKLSPTLPLHFDKTYLPSQTCEKDYINLVECLYFFQNSNDTSTPCNYEVSKFQACKKNRDILILHGIKKWQEKHILQLSQPNQNMYSQGLNFKLNRLKLEYDRLPSTNNKMFRMLELRSQIQQLKWRIQYISKLI